jgi:hypothetical protein
MLYGVSGQPRRAFCSQFPEMSLVPREPFYSSIPRRLAELPNTWSPYDPRVLTEIDDRTDALLTQCGLREVGLTCVVRHERSDVAIHAYLLATGNWTIDDINRAVAPGCPPDWFNGESDVMIRLSLPDKHRRTMRGAEFLLMLQDQAVAQVIIREILSGRHVASPDIRLEEWRRHEARNGAGGTFAAAQADARTGDVTQSVHQPITVNNHVDMSPVADLVKVALQSRASLNPSAFPTGDRADLPSPTKEIVLAMLRPCHRRAYEAYVMALSALNDECVAAEPDAIWNYIKDVTITLADGMEYQPPPGKASYMNYVGRVFRAFEKVQTERSQ